MPELERIFYKVEHHFITLPNGLNIYYSPLAEYDLHVNYEGKPCIIMTVENYTKLLEEINGEV